MKRTDAPTNPRKALRDLIAGDEFIVCPGVVNALFGRMAENAGFPLIYTTGAGIANCELAVPDLGVMTMSELLQINQRVVGAVSIPVIADIDTGYGGAINVYRTVSEFETAGVAGVQIEDQVNPKRCGHFLDKRVVAVPVMIERLVAAQEARRDEDFVIIARTDALAEHGVAEAIARGQAYAEAGADVIFIEAPTNLDELRAVPKNISSPLLVNMVEGGLTPALSPAELGEMGYRIGLYANALMRMAAAGVAKGLRVLAETGATTDIADEMLSWDERQGLVDLDGWLGVVGSIEERAERLTSRLRGYARKVEGGRNG